MKPTVPLKYCSIAFTVLWASWMIWWSGIYHPVNVIILSICGAVAGYLWYRAMRWSFRRMKLLPPEAVDPGVSR